jgi:hypothetical protein
MFYSATNIKKQQYRKKSLQKFHSLFRNGVFSNPQTMEPPGYPLGVEAKG